MSSNSDEVDFFNVPNPSCRTLALGSTQTLKEMSTRNLPGGVKSGRHVRLTNLPPSVRRLSRENVGALTSHNPMGLYGLLQGLLYLFLFLFISNMIMARKYTVFGNHPKFSILQVGRKCGSSALDDILTSIHMHYTVTIINTYPPTLPCPCLWFTPQGLPATF
jgi:hypothetical protein